MNFELYDSWLQYLFDHEEAKGDWRYEVDYKAELEQDPHQIVAFTKRMFENYATDIDPYSDWQIAKGLGYFVDNGCSDMPFAFVKGPVPLEDRLAAIRSMKVLYEECFRKRCPPDRDDVPETKQALSSFCYMLWDITPLSVNTNKQEKVAYYDALFEVFKAGLHSTNPACIESALHGLGHLVFHYKPAVQLIDEAIPWIRRKAPPRIVQYAAEAKTGMIL